MLPHEREMTKRLAGKPFTLLGINSDQNRSVLKNKLAEQKVTWPNIYDGAKKQDVIGRKWNIIQWPTIYVIDKKGVIRHRELFDKPLEEAVTKLLNEN